MNKINCFAALVITLSLISQAVADDKKAEKKKPSPRENLKTAIPDMIQLLEKNDLETFIEHYIAPDDLKDLTKNNTIKELADHLRKKKLKTILEALKAVEIKKLQYNKKGDRANYTFNEEDAKDFPKDIIGFIKVGKHWYMLNRAKKIEE